MNSVLSALFKFAMSWTCSDSANALAPRVLSGVYPTPGVSKSLIAGTAAGQIDAMYINKVTVPAGSTATLDLNTVTDPAGNTPNFARVTYLMLRNNDAANRVVVGGGTHPLDVGVRATGGGAVTNKALTSNVATLTVVGHGLVVGQAVLVTGVDATFNGVYTVTVVGTSDTFSYAKTHADVVSAAATGTAEVIGTFDVWPSAVPTIMSRDDATGWVVVDSVSDTLTFSNASVADIVMDVIILGRKE